MKKSIVLGVDPGIANTGLAVVSGDGVRYKLLQCERIKSGSDLPTGERLAIIEKAIISLQKKHNIEAVAVEKVFHNKNISSSISTGKVIGVCELVAYHAGVRCFLLSPQDVKRASGFGGTADKVSVKRAVRGIFGTQIKSHHVADAAMVGLAGLLKFRALRCENRAAGGASIVR